MCQHSTMKNAMKCFAEAVEFRELVVDAMNRNSQNVWRAQYAAYYNKGKNAKGNVGVETRQ